MGDVGFYAEVNLSIARERDVIVTYDGYRFALSATDASGTLYQPRSEQDTLVAALRHYF